MFTLKLYHNNPGDKTPYITRSVILEATAFWVDTLDHGVQAILAFKKEVGVDDEGGSFRAFVGGDLAALKKSLDCPRPAGSPEPTDAIQDCLGGNYYTWGVIENAQGKTCQMLR